MRMRRPKKRTVGIGFSLIVLLGLAVFMFTAFKTVEVRGRSMLQTLKEGQRVLVCNAYWLIGGIRHRDIVVIKGDDKGEYMIKRVYKMAGETVDFVNLPDDWPLSHGDYVVPSGSVFVLGDNKLESEDSRKFGPVPMRDILGKVVLVPN